MLKYFRTSLAFTVISVALLVALNGALFPIAEVHAYNCQQSGQHQPADSENIPCPESCCVSLPLSATIPTDLGIKVAWEQGSCRLSGQLPSLFSSDFVRLIDYPPIVCFS